MAEPALVSSRQFAFDPLVVAENLERRPVVVVSRKTEMTPTKTRVRNRIDLIQPYCRQIAFRTFDFASENLAIELDQPFPISGYQVGVHVFCASWHSFILGYPYKYHN